MLGDLLNLTTKIVGGVVGTIGGVSYSVLATALGVSLSVIEEAVNAGCKTKEEIEDFIRNG
jgi:hypothetical protein